MRYPNLQRLVQRLGEAGWPGLVAVAMLATVVVYGIATA